MNMTHVKWLSLWMDLLCAFPIFKYNLLLQLSNLGVKNSPGGGGVSSSAPFASPKESSPDKETV